MEFLIVSSIFDEKTLYHCEASIKDAGKQLFSKEITVLITECVILDRLSCWTVQVIGQ